MRPRAATRALLSASLVASLATMPGCSRAARLAVPPGPCALVVDGVSVQRYDSATRAYVPVPRGGALRVGDVVRSVGRREEHLTAGALSFYLGGSGSCTVQRVEGTAPIPDVAVRLSEGTLRIETIEGGQVTVESYSCRATGHDRGCAFAVEVHEDPDRFTNTRFACLAGTLDVYGFRRKEPPVQISAGTELLGDDGGLKTPAPLGTFTHPAFGPPSPIPELPAGAYPTSPGDSARSSASPPALPSTRSLAAPPGSGPAAPAASNQPDGTRSP